MDTYFIVYTSLRSLPIPSWMMGAMYNEWKKRNGYNKLDPKENEGQCQSSMKEWEESIKKYNQ